jgi:hypothetical protein
MLWIRWAFIFANVAYCLMSLFWNSRTSLSRFGKIAGAAVWLWQLVGVTIVVGLCFSAWHLIWWFILGYLLIMWGVRIMCGMGYSTTN